jgi:triacylglycerol esterase/lipase EstA (alpha/beta hydrolase family)
MIGVLFINSINKDKSFWSESETKIKEKYSKILKTLTYDSSYFTNSSMIYDLRDSKLPCENLDGIFKEIDDKLDKLNCEKNILIAHSVGVFYALLYCCQNPKRIVIFSQIHLRYPVKTFH